MITQEQIQNLINTLKEKIKTITNKALVIEEKNIFLKNYVSPLYDQLKKVSPDQKKLFGQMLNQFKNSVNDLTNERIEEINQLLEKEDYSVDYDSNLETANLTKGSLAPLNLVANEVIDFFKKLNFKIVSGEEIVKIKDNFDQLNITKEHPARQSNDSFFINPELMLRAQCTATTAVEIFNNQNDDIRILCFGNVYRKDDDDATHSHQFCQIDIVWIRDGLSLVNLKWLIFELLKHLYGDQIKTRFRLSYFPFTEPSFEVDVSCPYCHNKGCSVCKQSGWIEILGAGMLNQNVLKNANIKIKTGLAAGLGIDRLAMIKYQINDIRHLYSNDFRVLNQFKKERKVC